MLVSTSLVSDHSLSSVFIADQRKCGTFLQLCIQYWSFALYHWHWDFTWTRFCFVRILLAQTWRECVCPNIRCVCLKNVFKTLLSGLTHRSSFINPKFLTSIYLKEEPPSRRSTNLTNPLPVQGEYCNNTKRLLLKYCNSWILNTSLKENCWKRCICMQGFNLQTH